jgi:hypothetical protein
MVEPALWKNPHATFKTLITVDDVLNRRMIA